MIRAPICTVVGHVDHGKTTLLDTLRGSATASGEAGLITQAIGASIIPIEDIMKRAGPMLEKQKVTIPGLLFIDTPGHAAFTGMRKRGGSLADIAVLIVDLNEGFKPQTKEALEILRSYKTPFVIAANKIDLSPGYKKTTDKVLLDINAQSDKTIEYVETKVYEIVGKLSEMGIPSDRFDRLESFEKQVAIVPISAKNKIGLDSLLAILVGLAQRYLEKALNATPEGPAKGTILEVSEEQGLGLTLNAIIYDGMLNVGDTIVIGSTGEPIVTRVRALLQPNPLSDIRDRKTKFLRIDKAVAATGVKISAPDLEGVTAGMPFAEASGDVERVKRQLAAEVEEVTIETDEEGLVLKADNIGSLEALINLLREKNVPIRSATVGPITKKDFAIASSHEPEHAVILGFNIPKPKDKNDDVKVFTADIIYKLIDDYQEYLTRLTEEKKEADLARLARPARIRVLEGCIFRASNPLICGVLVERGTLKAGARLIKAKNPQQSIAVIKEIQDNRKPVPEAKAGSSVALNVPGAVGGRHVDEGDVLMTAVPEEDFRELKKYAKQLSKDEIELLKEYAELMRQQNPMWGV